jgi:hypothetical protein
MENDINDGVILAARLLPLADKTDEFTPVSFAYFNGRSGRGRRGAADQRASLMFHIASARQAACASAHPSGLRMPGARSTALLPDGPG